VAWHAVAIPILSAGVGVEEGAGAIEEISVADFADGGISAYDKEQKFYNGVVGSRVPTP